MPDTDDNSIRLDQFLKLAGVAGTGGQAKIFIQDGQVRVNGEIETRRRHKLRSGDSVRIGDEEFVIGTEGERSELQVGENYRIGFLIEYAGKGGTSPRSEGGGP